MIGLDQRLNYNKNLKNVIFIDLFKILYFCDKKISNLDKIVLVTHAVKYTFFENVLPGGKDLTGMENPFCRTKWIKKMAGG